MLLLLGFFEVDGIDGDVDDDVFFFVAVFAFASAAATLPPDERVLRAIGEDGAKEKKGGLKSDELQKNY